jgi:hypothetical protein
VPDVLVNRPADLRGDAAVVGTRYGRQLVPDLGLDVSVQLNPPGGGVLLHEEMIAPESRLTALRLQCRAAVKATFVTLACAVIFATPALAVPPTLVNVSSHDRHPSATISAPKADSVTIYLASKPDRATDGSFLTENVKELGVLTDSEIQTGQWTDAEQVDPGTYWVILRASADFGACWIFDAGAYDPSCANGFSDVTQLVVPKPVSHYRADVSTLKFLQQATLRLIATPLGETLPYRACYQLKSRKRQCLTGTLTGYSWNASASGSLTVSTWNLAPLTTFTWFVNGHAVASKHVRVR